MEHILQVLVINDSRQWKTLNSELANAVTIQRNTQ